MGSGIIAVAGMVLMCANPAAGQGPSAPAPSPALLVLNKEGRTLAIVDPATNKVVGSVPVGDGPHEVTVSADGKFAFVGNYGGREPGNTLSVIDLGQGKELRRVDLAALRPPHGMFFSHRNVSFTPDI